MLRSIGGAFPFHICDSILASLTSSFETGQWNDLLLSGDGDNVFSSWFRFKRKNRLWFQGRSLNTSTRLSCLMNSVLTSIRRWSVEIYLILCAKEKRKFEYLWSFCAESIFEQRKRSRGRKATESSEKRSLWVESFSPLIWLNWK